MQVGPVYEVQVDCYIIDYQVISQGYVADEAAEVVFYSIDRPYSVPPGGDAALPGKVIGEGVAEAVGQGRVGNLKGDGLAIYDFVVGGNAYRIALG